LGGVRHAVSWLEQDIRVSWTGIKHTTMATEFQRLAFRMKLKPGHKEEYRKRHAEIWPELRQLLSDAGVYEYSIFLEEDTNTLFAFQKLKSGGGSQALGENPIVQRWWKYMADIMETNPDYSPMSVALEEVFYMP
jgi:L-rhamnose mutarotase